MARRFLRNVQVIVGDSAQALLVRNLYVRFDIKKEASNTPAAGDVWIYNLNESNETLIRERGTRLQLLAGYGGDENLRLLIDGEVRRVDRQREGLDRITKIALGGKVMRTQMPLFVHTFAQDVNSREALRIIVQSLPGLTLGPLDAIPADGITPAFSWDAPAWYAITRVVSAYDVEHYEENGIIQFSKRGQSSDDSNDGLGFTISQRSGMIGTPTLLEDSGIKVRTLLDPRLLLDSKVRVESQTLQQGAFGQTSQRAQESGGTYKITVLQHAGDNWDGEFYTEFEARALGTTPGTATAGGTP